MLHKLIRWIISVSGIILLVMSFLIYPSDLLMGFMIAFCGALMIALGLGFFGE